VAREDALRGLGDVEGLMGDLPHCGAAVLARQRGIVEDLDHLIGVLAKLIGGSGPRGGRDRHDERGRQDRQHSAHVCSIRRGSDRAEKRPVLPWGLMA